MAGSVLDGSRRLPIARRDWPRRDSMMKVYSLTARNRPAALLLGLVVLGAGLALLLVGIALLAGVAVVGGLVGTGILAWRRLRGTREPLPPQYHRPTALDPALEVFPERQVIPPPQGRA
jgi:hypothetical protein